MLGPRIMMYSTTGGVMLSPEELERQQRAAYEAEQKAIAELKALPLETKFGEIRAWRGWDVRYEQGRWWLVSISIGGTWPAGIVTAADCQKNSHRCIENLESGFYAIKSRNAVHHFSHVIGEVALWGNVVEHEKGYRAECMKILSLFPHDVSGLEVSLARAGFAPKRRWWRTGLQGIDIIGHDLRKHYLEDQDGHWSTGQKVHSGPAGKPDSNDRAA